MATPQYEYAFVWVGQDNGRPWGTKAEGFDQAPHLSLGDAGIDLVNLVIPSGSTSGTGKTLTCSTDLIENDWVGAQLRLGTTAAPKKGVATVTSNIENSITVDWDDAAASAGTVQAYLVRPSDGRKTYPTVRVLTPYQPEGPDVASVSVPYPTGTVRAPGYTVPATITSYANLGLFLPFSFLEGIDSHGICESTDSYTTPASHACTAVAATTFDFSNAVIAGTFYGGYIRVTHNGGVSYSAIGTNTATQFTGLSWSGNGTPTTGGSFPTVGDFIYEAWVPHYNNSPHAYTPGIGFRYPSNDMQPCWEGDGRIHNRPRGIDTYSYGDRFGSMLEFGWRMSAALGKRINMIHLSVNDATLIPNYTTNLRGFDGTLGWWDSSVHHDWALTTPNGIATRLENMISVMAPAALTAEGSSLPLRILGIVMPAGEMDAKSIAGQGSYARSLLSFIRWLRNVIDTAGFNPYSSEAKIPVVHPYLTQDPWTTVYDTEELINRTIGEVIISDGFGATIDPEDSSKTGGSENFDGGGEATNGLLMAATMGELVDNALEYGAAVLDAADTIAVDICNQALSFIGENPNVTALDGTDTTRNAGLCRQFYATARDSLLTMRNWGFALRREPLRLAVNRPLQWQYAYVVPPGALKVLAVLSIEAEDDYSTSYSTDVFLSDNDVGVYTTQPYTIEQAEAGHRALYTNQEEASVRYIIRVLDSSLYPSLFKLALAWHLAMMLAGPIIKGEEGAAEARRAAQMMAGYLASAGQTDAAQREIRPTHNVPWLSTR